MSCNRSDCKEYPHFGVAPHECYWRKEGGFSNPLGTSTIEPPDEWPDNFLAEIYPDEDLEEKISWGLCGAYFCPSCKRGMEETKTLWGKDRIQQALVESARNKQEGSEVE